MNRRKGRRTREQERWVGGEEEKNQRWRKEKGGRKERERSGSVGSGKMRQGIGEARDNRREGERRELTCKDCQRIDRDDCWALHI